MAKQTSSKKPVVDEKVEVEESVETTEVSTEKEAPSKPNRPVYANKLTVTLKNGTVRVYTPFTHGKVWEVIAKNYAEANEGSTIE